MKARAMGRFLSEFLDGMTSGKDASEEAPTQPVVVPVETVREAVTPMIRQIVLEMLQQAMAAEEPSAESAPSGQQLDMMFADAAPGDPLAERMRQRVHDINAKQAEKDKAERAGGEMPEMYDPNMPDGKPWQAPTVA